MAPRPQLTLGSTLVLIAVLSALAYAQQHWSGGGRWDGGGRPESRDTGSDDGASQGGNVAGQFDYYALVMSWSPTHCALPEASDDAAQCARRDGRRFAFVLHGLWPQYERGYPENCRTRARPFVPEPVIDSMVDVMPSRGLVIHEFRKHGTCSGLDPFTYFQTARQLFKSVRIPERYVNPLEAQFVAPNDFVGEFSQVNPGLKPSMIAVECGGAGNRLTDVRICTTRDGTFRACGENENRGQLCRAQSMYVPPVRSAR